ncbi:MAG: DUF3990 domain-containing protein [Lachnospiraceae bacterium]|nr:DUF3990 domain-containing protein [Lachnospiraceae bacterium]
MIEVKCEYKTKEDIEFLLEADKITREELADRTGISRTTIVEILKGGKTIDAVNEKLYSYAYVNGYRINTVKEELLKEQTTKVLFHGSKYGLSEISIEGARGNCDFGKGFYLGETYDQALAFICENERSSVYSFTYSLDDLRVKKFDCTLEWMLAICYYRGSLKDYSSHPSVQKIIAGVEDCDVVVAPIADNKMFYIMAQYTEGEINSDVALHSLSASKLGFQYVFKTDKALKKLKPVEKYYISAPEREDCKRRLNERAYEIDTKLKLAKREFKEGLFIEELLK